MNSSSQLNNEQTVGGGRKQQQKQQKQQTQQRQNEQKEGGAMVDDLKNLAVPFALLLAKEGLQGLFQNKSDSDVGVSARKSASAKKASASSTAKKSASATKSASAKKSVSKKNDEQNQQGGACTACQSSCGGKAGGSNKKANSEVLKKNYTSLANKINEFLSKY